MKDCDLNEHVRCIINVQWCVNMLALAFISKLLSLSVRPRVFTKSYSCKLLLFIQKYLVENDIKWRIAANRSI